MKRKTWIKRRIKIKKIRITKREIKIKRRLRNKIKIKKMKI